LERAQCGRDLVADVAQQKRPAVRLGELLRSLPNVLQSLADMGDESLEHMRLAVQRRQVQRRGVGVIHRLAYRGQQQRAAGDGLHAPVRVCRTAVTLRVLAQLVEQAPRCRLGVNAGVLLAS